jgi:hypothetical protein
MAASRALKSELPQIKEPAQAGFFTPAVYGSKTRAKKYPLFNRRVFSFWLMLAA